MTGPYDDGPSGMFDHLDDPAAPAASREMLASVVHRGRRIRARRQGAIAMSGAAAVTAAVLGGLGISHTVGASNRDSVFTPANSASPSFSASTGPGRHHRAPGVAVVVPHGAPGSSPASPSMPPSPLPCATAVPTSSPSPLPGGPVVEASVPPLLPTATPEPCPSETSSPSPTPSDTASPEPTTTDEPSSSPSPEPAATP